MDAYLYCPMCRTELIVAERGGTTRKACPEQECGFVAWNNPVPVAAAIVEHAGKVILVRSHGWPETAFGMVAGFVESGETPEAAIRREVLEEIGIEVQRTSYLGTYPFPERNQIIFVYHADAPHEEITLCKEELADYRAIAIERLVPWSRGTGPALRDWLATRGYDRKPVPFGEHMK